MSPVLQLNKLEVEFSTLAGKVHAVRGIDLALEAGEAHAVVGESGSGKSQSFLAVMGLLSGNATTNGEAKLLGGENLLTMSYENLDKVRGSKIAMVFQDPMSSLHPSMRVGKQMTEGYVLHNKATSKQAEKRAISMLDKVGVPEPQRRFEAYPHQLSGGLRQRVMIAMSLMCEPEVLIADEPTTALDVTIQAQILDLFADLRREFGMALVMITHDLAVVASLCDTMTVLYAGRVVESGKVSTLVESPQHPYTLGLLHSTPRQDKGEGEALSAIPGQPPDMLSPPEGCAFRLRCPFATDKCLQQPELLTLDDGRQRACYSEHLDADAAHRFLEISAVQNNA